MNQLSVKILPSGLSPDEKERRLQETLELLLHTRKGKKGEEKTTGKIAEIKSTSHNTVGS